MMIGYFKYQTMLACRTFITGRNYILSLNKMIEIVPRTATGKHSIYVSFRNGTASGLTALETKQKHTKRKC